MADTIAKALAVALAGQGGGASYSAEAPIDITDNVIGIKLDTTSGLKTNDNNELSIDGSYVQHTLTAGDNINITNNVISATDTTYSAGDEISISNNVISHEYPTIVLSASQVISADPLTLQLTDEQYNILNDDSTIIVNVDSTALGSVKNQWKKCYNITNVILLENFTGLSSTSGSDIIFSCIQVNKSNKQGVMGTKKLQEHLTAGNNISISGNTISATDTTYSAGTNVQINNNVISATDTTYSAGTNITIDANNVISANIDSSYSIYYAGDPITYSQELVNAAETPNTIISRGTSSSEDYDHFIPFIGTNGNINLINIGGLSQSPIYVDMYTISKNGMSVSHFDTFVYNDTGTNDGTNWLTLTICGETYNIPSPITYTAGSNISINNNIISATDTTYTAGTNITIDANNVISASSGASYTAGNGIDITNNVISNSNFQSMTLSSTSGTITDDEYSRISNNTPKVFINDFCYVYGRTQQDGTIEYRRVSDNNDIFQTDSDGWRTKFEYQLFFNTDKSYYMNNGSNVILKPGNNISIVNDGTISATDTTYTAGTGISISDNTINYSATPLWATYDSTTGTLALSTTAPV